MTPILRRWAPGCGAMNLPHGPALADVASRSRMIVSPSPSRPAASRDLQALPAAVAGIRSPARGIPAPPLAPALPVSPVPDGGALVALDGTNAAIRQVLGTLLRDLVPAPSIVLGSGLAAGVLQQAMQELAGRG